MSVLSPPAPFLGPVGTSRRRVTPAAVLAGFALLLALPQNHVIAGIGASITPARLVAAVCLLWWVLARIGGGFGVRTARNPVRSVLTGVVLVLAAANALALATGTPDGALGPADRNTLLFAFCCGVALLACDGLDGAAALRLVFGAVVLGASVSALAAMVHFGIKVDLRQFAAFPGLEIQGLGKSDLARGGLERAMGFANHPIELAAVSAAAAPLALHLTKFGRFRPLWWGCIALLFGGVVVSISRTGLLGLVLVLVLALPRIGLLRWMFGALVLTVAGLVAGLAVPRLIEVLSDTVLGSAKDNSVSGRLDDYSYVVDQLAQRPLGGQGFGTYVAPPQPYLDNQYLLTAVESGVPGLLALLVLLGVPTWLSVRAWRGLAVTAVPTPQGPPVRDSSGLRDAAWAVGVGLAVCAACFATFDALAFPQFQALTFLLIGMAGAVVAQARKAQGGQT